MKTRLGLLAGIALSATGVLGIAGSGIAWNFIGRTVGLGGTISSLVLVAISVVLLRPLPPEPVLVIEPQTQATLSEPIRLKRPEASLIGSLLATFGTLGLAASGLLWNFQGLAFGLTGTITSLAALAFSVLFLWPLASRPPAPTATSRPSRTQNPLWWRWSRNVTPRRPPPRRSPGNWLKSRRVQHHLIWSPLHLSICFPVRH